jgi:hypothetical protein
MTKIRIALIVLLLFSSAALAQRGQQGTPAANATASLPFDPHDLSGIWSRNSQGFGGGGTCRECGDRGFNNDVPPMTPAGEAKFNANKPSYGRELGSAAAAAHPEEHIGRRRAVPPGQGNDLVTACNPSGVPRMLLYPDPIEFMIGPDKILQTFQWTHQWRTIWTDGRKLPEDPDLLRWYGYSVAKWDGNTFVIDSAGFDDRTWIDHFGYPHSDQMHLQERYRRVDHDTLELSMTIDDPKIYTKPWVSQTKRFKLLKKEDITYDGWYGMLDEPCAPVDDVDSFINRVVRPAGGATEK